MAIRVEHGKPSTLLTAAQISGEVRAAQRQAELNARIQEQQLDIDYRVNLKQQDIALDLEMQQRAKLWEVEKMQLRSQIDFQREEQKRQRELDTYDNIETQIKKEVQSGRMSEEEAEPFLFSNNLNRQGANISPSQVKQLQQEEDDERFGVQPYWMRGKEAPEGTPERQLYESKLAEGISGERRGTVPYYLDPRWLRETNRDVVEQVLMSREIFFNTPEELDAFIERAGEAEMPLADKELDIGVRVQPGMERPGTEETTGLPRVTSDADYDALPSGTEFIDQSGKRWRKP